MRLTKNKNNFKYWPFFSLLRLKNTVFVLGGFHYQDFNVNTFYFPPVSKNSRLLNTADTAARLPDQFNTITEQQKGQTASSYRSSSILQNTAFYGSLCIIPVFQFCSQKATKHHNPFPLDSNPSDWNRPPVPTPSARRGYASFRRPHTFSSPPGVLLCRVTLANDTEISLFPKTYSRKLFS